jgi:NAD(P)-dependent dehydrogenase (short-subunit alcohol dehydrogenase family)
MARVFISGSTEGLGRAAAQSLMDDGHDVVLHARSSGARSGAVEPGKWLRGGCDRRSAQCCRNAEHCGPGQRDRAHGRRHPMQASTGRPAATRPPRAIRAFSP